MQGGRFGWFVDYNKDNPTAPFAVYNRDGQRVVIPAGQVHAGGSTPSSTSTTRARAVTGTIRYRIGNYYDGDFKSLELTSDYRITPQVDGQRRLDAPGHRAAVRQRSSTTWCRSRPTTRSRRWPASRRCCSTTGRPAQFSSNVRLALLNRSGTGLFVVYNDRRDTSSFTPLETLGRSFVVKYTRLFDL